MYKKISISCLAYTLFACFMISLLRGFHALPAWQCQFQWIPFYQFYDYYYLLTIQMTTLHYIFQQIFLNLLVLMPLGLLLALYFKELTCLKALGLFCLCSFGIELFEIITHFGTFDVTDIIMNSLGAWIVFVIVHHLIISRAHH